MKAIMNNKNGTLTELWIDLHSFLRFRSQDPWVSASIISTYWKAPLCIFQESEKHWEWSIFVRRHLDACQSPLTPPQSLVLSEKSSGIFTQGSTTSAWFLKESPRQSGFLSYSSIRLSRWRKGEGGFMIIAQGWAKGNTEKKCPSVRALMRSRDEIASLMMSAVYWPSSGDVTELWEGRVPSKTECRNVKEHKVFRFCPVASWIPL